MATQILKMAAKPADLAALSLSAIALLFPVSTYATDFDKVGKSITAQEQLVSSLVATENVFSQSLIEPLVHLAKLQKSANHFSDAQQTISKAIQAARIAHGLYNEKQLPLLQLDIETCIALSDWTSAKDKLDHYTWLLIDHVELPIASIVDSLQWLVSAHEQGTFAATEEDRIWHITRATSLSKALVRLMQQEGLEDSLPHVQFLYDLTQIHYLEARAILAGGTTGFQLREAHAAISNVESRANSLRRLYNSGLDRLTEIRAIMRNSDKFNAEAISIVDLRVADWKALFGQSEDIAKDYGLAINHLKLAGVSDSSIHELLEKPTSLPRPRLSLSVAEEIYDVKTNKNPSASKDAVSLAIFEATSDIPGVAKEVNPHTWSKLTSKGWGSVIAEITLDPSAPTTLKNSGYRTKSNVTPKQISILATHDLEEQTLSNVQKRIAMLSFRPAFLDGKPIPSKIVLDYRFTGAEWNDQAKLITLR